MIELYTAIFLFGIGAYLNKNVSKKDTEKVEKKETTENVYNTKIIEKVDELNQYHDITWCWVKGHSGHRENEIADMLANKGIDEL